MKLQLCSLEFWRSFARPSPARPPPPPLPARIPAEDAGPQGPGGRKGKDPPETPCQAWHLSGFQVTGGPEVWRHPRDPAPVVASSHPQPGLGPKKPGKPRLESLDRVKRADIERAKTRFTPPLPSRGKQDFRIFENIVKCGWCEASRPTTVAVKMLQVQRFPECSPPWACVLQVTLDSETCDGLFCWFPPPNPDPRLLAFVFSAGSAVSFP